MSCQQATVWRVFRTERWMLMSVRSQENQKQSPLCFPSKVDTETCPGVKSQPQSRSDNHLLCQRWWSVGLRTWYQIILPKLMNICFDQALPFVVCISLMFLRFWISVIFFPSHLQKHDSANPKSLREESLSSVTLVKFFFVFLPVSPRENGTHRNRISFWIPSRTLISDVLWRGFSRAPCCNPGCPAGLSLSPRLGESSTPGAWGLCPATSPGSCESLRFHSKFVLIPKLFELFQVNDWTNPVN